MTLIKHDLSYEPETPREGVTVLILLETDNEYIWSIGHYNNFYGWVIYNDVPDTYKVVEWYGLPKREKSKEEKDKENKQMRLEDYFWSKK